MVPGIADQRRYTQAVKPACQLLPSQVFLTTVFTVCFGVLAVIELVLFVTHTLFALVITASALMIAVALDRIVALLVRRGMKRGLAIGLVAVSSLAVIAGAVFLLIPPVVSQTKQLAARAPGSGTPSRTARTACTPSWTPG